MNPILLSLIAMALGCGYETLGDPPLDNHREERVVSPTADEARCDTFATRLAAPSWALETHDVDCDHSTEPYCFRLNEELRAVAAAADPLHALTESAASFAAFARSGDPLDEARGRAFADLAVSGGRAYEAFVRAPPNSDDLASTASPEGLEAALERAYAVAWALHGPPAHRAAARPGLGWIAVSPEDDLPPRPVNLPSTPFRQHDLDVDVEGEDGSTRTLRTRVLVASASGAPGSPAPARLSGVLPEEGPPSLPREGDVLLYVHGHSSFAEESTGLAEELIRRRAERGRELTLIAFDLPGSGYTERVDPTELLGEADATSGQDALLRFLDRFVAAVVVALERLDPTVPERIAAVVGGSLGGNMALRLAERADELEWVSRAVAWSPVSIDYSWTRAKLVGGGDEGFMDVIKHEAVRRTHHESLELEDLGARHRYFTDGVMSVRKQSDYWYRDGWQPCGDTLVEEGLRQLGEVYDSRMRRFHYRLAYEQLVFSHLEVAPGTSRRRFETIDVPLLLIAGEEDDRVPMRTRFFVDRLAPHLQMPGETLVFTDTGHALHSERPAMLAEAIEAFLADD